MFKGFYKVQNIQSEHNYIFLNEISYVFRLKCVAINRLIAKKKKKIYVFFLVIWLIMVIFSSEHLSDFFDT